jgi:sodium pump decarboxylase gamma subunit
MLNQLLGATMQDGVLTFLLGMLVVFGGIAIIVLFVSIAGIFFNKSTKEQKAPVKQVKQEVKEVQPKEEELPTHIKAAIVAAISAYYFTANANSTSKCDFVVKKIKRI